ncbi:MAG: dephospho-CoA kinase [Flavobacteriales bacterium]|nr:dephospho-CoA kinase [Flavobacteriales bacterium]
MTYCVGLTGGIGSGKSTVTTLFQKLGVTIIDADEIAHNITKPNTYCYESIVEHFGNNILQSDDSLNRKMIRDIVFKNPEERKWLEARLHPVIREAMKERIAKSNAVYNILVIPLLAEKNAKNHNYLNRICVIEVPIEQQIQRTIERDHITEAQVREILATQATNEERLKIADDIIYNGGDLSECRNQILELNQKYLSLAEKEK